MPTRDRTFAELFRSIVGPRLREYCRALGADVAWNMRSFSEAHAMAMHYACRFGASHLTEGLRLGLCDQIGSWILEAAGAVAERLEVASE